MVTRDYFALPEILEQGFSIHDILYMVENRIIRTRIRLFCATGRFCEMKDNNGMQYLLPLKESEVSGLFVLPMPEIRKIIKDGDAEVSLLLSGQEDRDYVELDKPVKLDFCDVVITREEKQHLEKMYGNGTKPSDTSDFTMEEQPNGYTVITHKGRRYTFGRIQTAIIRQLYEAHCDRTVWVYGKKLMEGAGSSSNRLCEIFRRHGNWRELIAGNKQGLYRLNI